MHFILLKYIHNIIRYMCFYKNRLNLPRSPLHVNYSPSINVDTLFYLFIIIIIIIIIINIIIIYYHIGIKKEYIICLLISDSRVRSWMPNLISMLLMYSS